MNWFFIALVSPALWAVTNHIDKHLINKYFKSGGVGALVIFSALIGVLISPIIYLINPDVFSIQPILALLIIANGFIYIFHLILYLNALAEDETSIVIPLFQTIPFFSYILGLFFLGEKLATIQIVASLFIITGAIILSLDFGKGIRLKKKVFWLMMLSAFLAALNGFIFKIVAINEPFLITSFWEYVGLSIFAIILLVFIKSYRKQFFFVIKSNTKKVLKINAFNEIINIIAKIIMNFASLLAPLALVWVINGVQPLFVLIIGIILTLFFPSFGKENISKRHLFQKIFAILIMFIGVYLLKSSVF